MTLFHKGEARAGHQRKCLCSINLLCHDPREVEDVFCGSEKEKRPGFSFPVSLSFLREVVHRIELHLAK